MKNLLKQNEGKKHYLCDKDCERWNIHCNNVKMEYSKNNQNNLITSKSSINLRGTNKLTSNLSNVSIKELKHKNDRHGNFGNE